jgi:hypothetical protein
VDLIQSIESRPAGFRRRREAVFRWEGLRSLVLLPVHIELIPHTVYEMRVLSLHPLRNIGALHPRDRGLAFLREASVPPDRVEAPAGNAYADQPKHSDDDGGTTGFRSTDEGGSNKLIRRRRIPARPADASRSGEEC